MHGQHTTASEDEEMLVKDFASGAFAEGEPRRFAMRKAGPTGHLERRLECAAFLKDEVPENTAPNGIIEDGTPERCFFLCVPLGFVALKLSSAR